MLFGIIFLVYFCVWILSFKDVKKVAHVRVLPYFLNYLQILLYTTILKRPSIDTLILYIITSFCIFVNGFILLFCNFLVFIFNFHIMVVIFKFYVFILLFFVFFFFIFSIFVAFAFCFFLQLF